MTILTDADNDENCNDDADELTKTDAHDDQNVDDDDDDDDDKDCC